MMKGSKRLLLLAALLVGFGVTTSSDAATIQSVQVTKPDSGALKGIDSTFVVKATVFDLSPIDTLKIYMYLTSGNDSTVVKDTVGVSHTAAILARTAGASLVGNPTNSVAVQTLRGNASGTFNGDADSVVVTKSGETTIFTWYGKIDASSGVHSNVGAGVWVIDSDNVPTAISLSSGATFNIDADRPQRPDNIFSVTPYGGITAMVDTTREILGIGDSVVVRTVMGNIGNGVVLGDSLSLSMDMFGKLFALNKNDRNVDTLHTKVTAAAGQFSDLFTGHGSANSDTVSVYTVDKAGNRSGDVDGSAAGATATVTFLFDTTAPILDGQVAAGDTILPVSNDTITDGSINSGFANDLNALRYNLPEALDSLDVAFSGASALKIRLRNNTTKATIADSALGIRASRYLNFTAYGNAGASGGANVAVADSVGTVVSIASQSGGASVGGAADTLLKTGVHSIAFQG